MTVVSTNYYTNATGDGATLEFSFNFPYSASGDVKALVDNVEVASITVSGDGTNGVVTFATAPADGAAIYLYRETQGLQQQRFAGLAVLDTSALESALDRVHLLGRETQAHLDRVLQFPRGLAGFDPTLPSTLTAGRALVVNSDADGFILSTFDPDQTVSEASASATAALASQVAAAASASEAFGYKVGAYYSDLSAQEAAVLAQSYAAEAAFNTGGLVGKEACYHATTGNLNATYSNGTLGVGATLTNAGALAAFSADGVAGVLNRRVLVKSQTNAAQNGIYKLTTVGSGAVPWVLTRATDYDEAAEILENTYTLVRYGDTCAEAIWAMSGDDPITMGTTDIPFTKVSFAGSSASTSSPGAVQLASDAEAQAMSSTGRALTPSNLAAMVASAGDMTTGTADDRFVTPLKFAGSVLAALQGLVILEDQQTSGTSGGGLVSGAFRTRTLNTKVFDGGGLCTLASNQITLAAGTYLAIIRVPLVLASGDGTGVRTAACRLQNVTDGTTVASGTGGEYRSAASSTVESDQWIFTTFTIGAAKALEVQQQVSTTGSRYCGLAASMGTEVYTQAFFLRIG